MPKHRETVLVKAIYIVAFLFSGALSFLATGQFAAWVQSKSALLAMLPVQVVLSLLPWYLLAVMEGRVVWRLTQQDGFSTIYPVSTGIWVGYLIHFG